MGGERQIYVAIDLGTTNTVLTLGKRNIDNTFGTEVIEIPQFDATKNLIQSKLLPSVLYVDNDERKYVGKIGKWMRENSSNRVVYNSKRFIGTDSRWKIGETIISPVDVATELLKVCMNTIKRYTMGREIKGVTITVPASFNTDQINDTVEAAIRAGFNRKSITTISEPTAALIDYINIQSKRIQEDRDVDFSKLKRILVFDIGGGTCDIAIIDVVQEENNLSFKEIAVGRYDDLGGVDFDTWAANYLLNKFAQERKLNLNELSEIQKNHMINQLIIFAEQAKERISSEVENMEFMGIEKNNDEISFTKSIPDFYNDEICEFSLTKREFDLSTKPLYYKSTKVIKDQRELPKYKNIEDPILNTLTNYNIPISSIDYVFLTGGMSKYIGVQERVKEILGKDIILSPHPMEAVSRGAAIYNYYSIEETKSDNDVNPKEIQKDGGDSAILDITKVLAEAIMIDVDEGLPEVILKANQRIPYTGQLKGKLKTSSPSGLKINLYAGKDKYDSAMRIQRSYTGSYTFPVKTGTPITIEYSIDENKHLSMEVVVEDSLNERIKIGVESDVNVYEGR